MEKETRPFIPWQLADDFMTAVFEKVGVPEADARLCSDVLLESDRRGIESHGCNRFKPIYIDRIKAGILNPVKITDMKDRLIKNLSKGYRQRVGLAQAILGYPEVIILDEPTVGLDPKQIIEIRDLIKSLKQKHTVILSSHILSEVRAVCDYVLIISHGKLVASDTPDNLERLAAGSNSLLMKVKGEKDTIRKDLETIEGVTGVEMSYDSDEELWKTKVSIQENVDIREKVFYAMAKANCPIYEMQVKRVSLEDVFLELTEGEKKKSTGKQERSQWKPVEDKSSETEKSEKTEKASDKKEGDQS
mgnify:CR=1 FL=1